MRFHIRLVVLVSAFFSGVVAAGCGQAKTQCLRMSDCSGGYYCDGGHCTRNEDTTPTTADAKMDAMKTGGVDTLDDSEKVDTTNTTASPLPETTEEPSEQDDTEVTGDEPTDTSATTESEEAENDLSLDSSLHTVEVNDASSSISSPTSSQSSGTTPLSTTGVGKGAKMYSL